MPTPLKKHLRFHATSDEQLSRAVEQTLGARLVQAPDRAFSSVGHQFALPRSELWYCSYSEPTTLRFAAGDYLRVQVPRSGTAVTRTEGRAFAVGSGHGCISSSEATIEFGAGFQQIAWRVSREELVRKLAAISGQPCTKPLRFDPEIDLEAPFARGVSTIVNSLVTCIDTLPAESRSLVVTELEEALVVALLGGAQHSLRSLLERRIDRPATWQVRRIERFIDANCDRPIGIEELVALSGSSARSIYRAFREFRGYSPMEFVLQRRLERARRQLADPANRSTITAVALASGFANASHFSRTFSAAFGVSPSDFVRTRER